MQQMYQQYYNQGLMVLSLGWQESQSTCLNWINTHGLTYPVLSDMSTTTSRLFIPNQGGSYYFPHNSVIDNTQILRYNATGFNHSTIENMVLSLMEPAVGVSPVELNFGSTIIGGIVQRTLYVDNTGTGILQVTNIYSSDPSLFTANPTSGQAYAVEGDLEVTVTFHAPLEGNFNETLYVVTSAGTVEVDLEAAVAGSGPFLWVEPLEIDFSQVEVGESLQETLWAYSLGQQQLNISAIAIAHPDFTVNPTSANLPSGDSLQVTLTYNPTSMDTIIDILSFTSTGGNRDIDVIAMGIQAIISSSANEVNFGTVNVGTQHVESFTIYNTGNVPLTISNVIVQTNIEEIFYFVQNTEIAPFGSTSCFVRWTPESPGTLNGNITFESNGGDLVVNLIGEAEGEAVSGGEWAAIPTRFALGQNFPNPFNASTMIPYALPHSAPVKITIYNTYGRLVQSFDLGDQPAGWHSISWSGDNHNGNPVSAGIYFYRLLINGKSKDLHKMLYLK